MSEPLRDEDGDLVEHVYEGAYTPRDASRILGVSAVTLARWSREGRIRCVHTVGGHRRYPSAVVRAALEGDWEAAAGKAPEEELDHKDTVVVFHGD